MTANHMVEKLLIVSTDAEQIWNAFEIQFPGLFTGILQEKYNIGDKFSQRVKTDFKREVEKLERQT